MTEPQSDSRPQGPPWRPVEYERGGVRWFNSAMYKLSVAIHPILAQLGSAQTRELPQPPDETTVLPPEASPLYKTMTLSHEWVASVEDVVNFRTDQFLAELYAAADDIGGQMLKGMFDHLSTVLEGTGNSIDAAGRDFFDVFIETLEKIDVPFDEEGKVQLTIVMHPDQLTKMRERHLTPEQEVKINEILSRRREEWIASRRRRELPG